MLKRSIILLTTVLVISESDYPETGIYNNTGNTNNSINLTMINNPQNVTMIQNGVNYTQGGISAPRSALSLFILDNKLDRSIENVQSNIFGKYALNNAYNRFDDYIYDQASYNFATSKVYGALNSVNYKKANIVAMIQKDSHASWFNLVAQVRNTVNETILKEYNKDIEALNQFQNTLNAIYKDNIATINNIR